MIKLITSLTFLFCIQAENLHFGYYFNEFNSNIINLFENATQISGDCRIAYEYAKQNNIDEYIKMLDATGKLSSGILNGNINQYGDYSGCIQMESAKYCLMEINVDKLWLEIHPELRKYRNNIHSNFMIKDTFNDPKHRVPGFTSIRWGFCVPDNCSRNDVGAALTQKFDVDVNTNAGNDMCQTYRSTNLTAAHHMFFILTLFIIVASFLDNIKTNNKIVRVVQCFSLRTNYKQLKTIDRNETSIAGVDGVRALSALALLMAHKSMALLYNPYINRTEMSEILGKRWSILGRNAIIYTDCFLLLSGLLNTNSFISDYLRFGKMRTWQRVVNRLFRILPNLLAIIMFCTYILPDLNQGPLWPLVIDHHAQICKKHMWRNFLFIHNYFGFENMCLTHTHHIGTDMQLFLITPLIVYSMVTLRRSYSVAILIVLALISSILRFIATFNNDLSHVVHYGIPVSRMFDTANLSYILPTHRLTIYLIGVLLAYTLQFTSKIGIQQPRTRFYIWCLMYVIGFSIWLGPVFMVSKTYKYDRVSAATYAAISPVFWGAAVAWVIYAINRNFGQWFKPVLTWPYFQYFTKISYSFYLVQFPMFFYNVGTTKTAKEYSTTMLLEPVEVGCVLVFAVALTLTVEMPCQRIGKLIIPKQSIKVDKSLSNRVKKRLDVKSG